jgi:copper chaperone CopZ
MIKEKIKIEGMSCVHCVMAVRKELSKLPLKVKDVSIGSAEVEYEETKITNEDIKQAIDNAGYTLITNY